MLKNLVARLAVYYGLLSGEPVAAAPEKPKYKISSTAVANSARKPDAMDIEAPAIERYTPPAGVVPQDVLRDVLAMDSTDYSYVNQFYDTGAYFRGYPYLAMLTQRPEFRKMAETLAKEMTRKWVKVTARGDDDKSEKIARIEKALEKHRIRKLFRRAAELDAFYGRGQIFIDVAKPGSGASGRDDLAELKTPLLRDPAKIKKGGLIGFRCIEPVWTYPSAYNGSDPLAPDYYKPSSWFVMGREVHGSRLLMFVSREVPDLLKAAYNFGGVSLSQLAEPYVDNWIRTRASVGDLIHSFSTSGIKTDMSQVLAGGAGQDLMDRAQLFNNLRDNRGLLMLDKEAEEFFQFNTPLSGIDALQAQAQEQLASVSNIPLVKLLGIQPAGLNASSDGEIRVFYDYVHSVQEDLYREPLKTTIEIIQLDEFGEIDPDIGFEFEPLWQASELEQAQIQQANATTDATLIGAGIISQDEARQRIADDPHSGYHSLEINDVPGELDADENNDDDSTDFGGDK